MNNLKICMYCKIPKNIQEFNRNNKERDKHRHDCKKCQHDKMKIYRQNPIVKKRRAFMRKLAVKRNPNNAKNSSLKSRFGITLEDYNKMLLEQNNKCFTCKKEETAKHNNGKIKNLSVDHCHKTGKIRGLLCMSCNIVLGKVEDNITILYSLINYLVNSTNNSNK